MRQVKLLTAVSALAICAGFNLCLSVCRQDNSPGRTSRKIHVVDSAGQPIAGAHVYRVSSGEGPGAVRGAQLLGSTDALGEFSTAVGKDSRTLVLLAVTPAHRMGLSRASDKLVVGSVAPLHLRMTNGNGDPLAGREVHLFPTSENGHPQGFVEDYGFPDVPLELHSFWDGKTQADGTVDFSDLPTKLAWSVTVDLGQSEPVLLRGAVWAGKRAEISVPLDRTIGGRLFRKTSGEAVGGARVVLVGRGYHHDLGLAVTDSNGFYSFMGLPAGEYSACMQDARAIGAHQDGTDDWLPLAKDSAGNWLDPYRYQPFNLGKGSVEHADFALIKAAQVTAVVVDEKGRPLPDANVVAHGLHTGGEGHPCDKLGRALFSLVPGEYKFDANRRLAEGSITVSKNATVREGEQVELRIVIEEPP